MSISNILPELKEGIENLKSNNKTWQKMVETEEDLKIYEERKKNQNKPVEITFEGSSSISDDE